MRPVASDSKVPSASAMVAPTWKRRNSPSIVTPCGCLHVGHDMGFQFGADALDLFGRGTPGVAGRIGRHREVLQPADRGDEPIEFRWCVYRFEFWEAPGFGFGRHRAHVVRSSSVVVTVASRDRLFAMTASPYSAG